MIKRKYLGIWMDYAKADLMEYTADDIFTNTIESGFTNAVKKHVLNKGISRMHNKEQQEQAAYHKKLGEAIINYDSVILFGPTNAKFELFNTLQDDVHFKKIKIYVTNTDTMTANQQHAFIKKYFSQS